MKNILESPQPLLDESFNQDLRDFVHACLNAPKNDSTTADRLLQNPLFTSAKARGVIDDDRIATIPNPPTHLLKACDTESGISYTLYTLYHRSDSSQIQSDFSFLALPIFRGFVCRWDQSNCPSQSILAAWTLGRGTRYIIIEHRLDTTNIPTWQTQLTCFCFNVGCDRTFTEQWCHYEAISTRANQSISSSNECQSSAIGR